MESKKIELFSSKTCPYCDRMKNWLDDKKIVYEVKTIGPEAKDVIEELRDRSGQLGVPVLFIEGVKDPIIGFNEAELEKLFAQNEKQT